MLRTSADPSPNPTPDVILSANTLPRVGRLTTGAARGETICRVALSLSITFFAVRVRGISIYLRSFCVVNFLFRQLKLRKVFPRV